MNREDRIVYESYLKTNEWKNKRIQKAEQQNYKCEICGKTVLSGYHIHHKTYKNFMNEPLSDLQFLCEDCHKEVHRKKHERTAYGVKSKPKNNKKVIQVIKVRGATIVNFPVASIIQVLTGMFCGVINFMKNVQEKDVSISGMVYIKKQNKSTGKRN